MNFLGICITITDIPSISLYKGSTNQSDLQIQGISCFYLHISGIMPVMYIMQNVFVYIHTLRIIKLFRSLLV